MKYVLLAGGMGTRLRPYTFTIPKPLLPLGNKALLDHIISNIEKFDPSEVILSLGYQSQLIRAYCQQEGRFKVNISFVEETKPLGTAGCIHLARERLAGEKEFFLMNGDIITKTDFTKLHDSHTKQKAAITVGVINHEYQSPYGVLEVKDNNLVSITEKPVLRQVVSAGIYCISADVVSLIPENTFFTMPDLMMETVRRGKKVLTYEIKEFWRALETKDNFDQILAEGILDDM